MRYQRAADPGEWRRWQWWSEMNCVDVDLEGGQADGLLTQGVTDRWWLWLVTLLGGRVVDLDLLLAAVVCCFNGGLGGGFGQRWTAKAGLRGWRRCGSGRRGGGRRRAVQFQTEAARWSIEEMWRPTGLGFGCDEDDDGRFGPDGRMKEVKASRPCGRE
ncbi:hypothetical protein Dimus_003333 [Dionaea muscipula]